MKTSEQEEKLTAGEFFDLIRKDPILGKGSISLIEEENITTNQRRPHAQEWSLSEEKRKGKEIHEILAELLKK